MLKLKLKYLATYAKVEATVLWSPDLKSQLIGKDSDIGGGGRWEQVEKWTTEDEMAGWHH